MIAYTCDSLLGNGISKLLQAEPDLDVINLNVESEEDILRAILDRKPQVLIFASRCLESNRGLIGHIMALHEDLRVIVVSAEESSFQIYDQQKVLIKKIDDFISAIFPKTGSTENL